MRKISFVLALLALLAMTVMPAAAQDEDPGTIADIVVASAGAEEPEFATLLFLVQMAAPEVLEALSDPEAELTVFAPTDAAFAALIQELGEEAFNELLSDPEALTDILLFHVVEGTVLSEDVVGMLEDGSFSVQSLNGQYIDIAGNTEDGITVDGANLVLDMVDIEAANGVIHVIDAAILPETRTIGEIVVETAGMEEDAEFTTLLTAVGAADEAVLTTLTDPEAELTVFAPTDEAFAALAEALGEEAFNGILEDPATLTDILLYHVLPSVAYSGDVEDLLFGDDMMEEEMDEMDEEATEEAAAEGEGDGEDMEAMDEEEMMEAAEIEVEMANGATATISFDGEGLFINDAMIIMTDIDAANGVIHVIDAVITPPSE